MAKTNCQPSQKKIHEKEIQTQTSAAQITRNIEVGSGT